MDGVEEGHNMKVEQDILQMKTVLVVGDAEEVSKKFEMDAGEVPGEVVVDAGKALKEAVDEKQKRREEGEVVGEVGLGLFLYWFLMSSYYYCRKCN